MGLETVVKDIMDAAQAEVSKLDSEADAEVALILDEAKQNAKRIMGERLAKAEDDIKKIRQQEISSANLEVKRTLLNARKEILEKVYVQAVETISEFSSEKNEELLKALISENEANGKKIYSNAESEEIVKKISSLEYAGNIDCLGGVVIENEDGTIRLDYTYDVILKSVNERLLKQTSDILFG
ncbi:archaeal/vacuolar-type H+-ATPase subunit E [Methanolobus tindarius DSM 2278]|jgi:V/A-type H+-transporting ATPase subunit E|uniref:A-type ATP synthase subunit E n=1 Tax=Methanolobus tindarius DSM 2278 TaxID=1090322 RepID=W9DN10_METTI|nr:V-type ATP synthase subunit E [Methanolobus tindarius]ETA67294.1 archaeal/vacuolar-type H+-ATPase subunit E [Methanolobus tindarius DSM 2278]